MRKGNCQLVNCLIYNQFCLSSLEQPESTNTFCRRPLWKNKKEIWSRKSRIKWFSEKLAHFVARAGKWSNFSPHQEGPFFTPHQLPAIFLTISTVIWNGSKSHFQEKSIDWYQISAPVCSGAKKYTLPSHLSLCQWSAIRWLASPHFWLDCSKTTNAIDFKISSNQWGPVVSVNVVTCFQIVFKCFQTTFSHFFSYFLIIVCFMSLQFAICILSYLFMCHSLQCIDLRQ